MTNNQKIKWAKKQTSEKLLNIFEQLAWRGQTIFDNDDMWITRNELLERLSSKQND